MLNVVETNPTNSDATIQVHESSTCDKEKTKTPLLGKPNLVSKLQSKEGLSSDALQITIPFPISYEQALNWSILEENVYRGFLYLQQLQNREGDVHEASLASELSAMREMQQSPRSSQGLRRKFTLFLAEHL
ncbi:hypothetical protein HNY73_000195 [Argiope bruennichi]|uniref:Uncharacterized protein n=1 Tax=Argiope bruennichi TaxID=94029 RepID=A0A8T0FZW1_ARGBR|nr:hypothetical protein HNY73_000195 [Argiope bruennichi]